jgi:hypothetical protein
MVWAQKEQFYNNDDIKHTNIEYPSDDQESSRTTVLETL